MLNQFILFVLAGSVAFASFLMNRPKNPTVLRNFGLVVIAAFAAALIFGMALDGDYNIPGPRAYYFVCWTLVIVSLAYVPYGIVFHRAHERKVRRARLVALTAGVSEVEEVDAPVETNELHDCLWLACFVVGVLGFAGVIIQLIGVH